MITLKDPLLDVGDLVWVKFMGWGGHSTFNYDSAAVYLGRSKKHQKRVAFWVSDPSIVVELEPEWCPGDVSGQLAMALSFSDVASRTDRKCWLNGLLAHLETGSIRRVSMDG